MSESSKEADSNGQRTDIGFLLADSSSLPRAELPADGPANLLTYFSPDYFTAKNRFLAACARVGISRHYSLPIEAPSPTSEPLTIDVTVFGTANPSSALVISSGVHGVEGCFGSAVQLACLDSLASNWRPPSGTALIMLHALNPFGFAWRRRGNEDNVDLNRNFLLADQVYSGSPPLSALFRRMLTPSGLHNRFALWPARMALLALRHGRSSFWETLPVGQYDFPDWLFFGGRAQTQTVRLLDGLLPTILGTASEVAHLDFHTGLGRWAECELLLSEQEEENRIAWWQQHFKQTVVKKAVASGNSYEVRGGFGPWLQSRFPNCRYHFAVAEFGTYSARRVIQALAEELRWNGKIGVENPEHWSRCRLADTFVPRNPKWRAKTLTTSLLLIQQAANVLWQ